jgi:hypothetical protein
VTHPLAGIDEKLRRAGEHLKTLQDEARSLLQRNSPTIGAEHADEQRAWFVVVESCPDVPPRFGVVLGEAIHNMRSALDHLIWQIVVACGNTPSQWNQFPIFDSPARFQKRVVRRRERGEPSMLLGVDDRTFDAIEQLQPYHVSSDRHVHALAVLRDLSNTDKHRLVHTSLYSLTEDTPQIEGTGFDAIEIHWGPTAIREGAKLARFRLVSTTEETREAEVEMHGSLTCEIRFGEIDIPLTKVVDVALAVRGVAADLAQGFGFEDPTTT